MRIAVQIQSHLFNLKSFISELEVSDYIRVCDLLDGASIGMHVRHIIELFQCLEQQYNTGTVNYDLRKRDERTENDPAFAMLLLDRIIEGLCKEDKVLKMFAQTDAENEAVVDTTYHRELVYNLEHCIHHEALIKVAMKTMNLPLKNKKFGYAPSTIKYQNQNSN